MRIGELARRLRVTERALRHYEDLGLLLPASTDGRTGYRDYGTAEFQRGVRIEQLKAAGLPLEAIASVLDGRLPLGDALDAQRSAAVADLAAASQRIAVIDELQSVAGAKVASAELVDLPAARVVEVRATCTPDALTASVRRELQRLRRRARDAIGFSAVFPLDLVEDDLAFELRAEVVDHDAAVDVPAATAIAVTVVGPLELLPLAYDAALAEVDRRRLTPLGSVVERYHDLSANPRVDVSVLVGG